VTFKTPATLWFGALLLAVTECAAAYAFIGLVRGAALLRAKVRQSPSAGARDRGCALPRDSALSA